MGRRSWFKIFADPWLRQTLREETAETRGVWADLLALAADSAYGDAGTIQLAPGVGLTDAQIIQVLHLTPDEWERTKPRLQETDRISVNGGNCIQIVNWAKYQSEYERQKPYRGEKGTGASQEKDKTERKPRAHKKKPKVTTQSYKAGLQGEGEREGEREGEHKEKKGYTVVQARQIIAHLNEKTGAKFKETKQTFGLIKARFNEGFGSDDFLLVIDTKQAEWSQEEKMMKYLRPPTLFGTKFESYVNESRIARGGGGRDIRKIVES